MVYDRLIWLWGTSMFKELATCDDEHQFCCEDYIRAFHLLNLESIT